MNADRSTKFCTSRRRRTALAALASLVLVFVGLDVLAHGNATGIVKERMDSMKSLGDAMKAVTAMIRGEVPYNAERVRVLSGQIGEHGGEALTRLFPKDSLDKPTEALPTIWADWDRFSALADRLSDYATGLGAAADNERPEGGMAKAGGMMQGAGMMDGNAMMMGGDASGPTVEHLSGMPPDAAYMHLVQTCADCHQDFRRKK